MRDRERQKQSVGVMVKDWGRKIQRTEDERKGQGLKETETKGV